MFAVESSGYVPAGIEALPGIDLGRGSAGPFTETPSRRNRKTYLSMAPLSPESDDQPPLLPTSWFPCSERLGACVQYGALASAGVAAPSAETAIAVRAARRASIELGVLALLLLLGDGLLRLLLRHRRSRFLDHEAEGLRCRDAFRVGDVDREEIRPDIRGRAREDAAGRQRDPRRRRAFDDGEGVRSGASRDRDRLQVLL